MNDVDQWKEIAKQSLSHAELKKLCDDSPKKWVQEWLREEWYDYLDVKPASVAGVEDAAERIWIALLLKGRASESLLDELQDVEAEGVIAAELTALLAERDEKIAELSKHLLDAASNVHDQAATIAKCEAVLGECRENKAVDELVEISKSIGGKVRVVFEDNVYKVNVSTGAKKQWHGRGGSIAEAVEQVKAMMEKETISGTETEGSQDVGAEQKAQ